MIALTADQAEHIFQICDIRSIRFLTIAPGSDTVIGLGVSMADNKGNMTYMKIEADQDPDGHPVMTFRTNERT